MYVPLHCRAQLGNTEYQQGLGKLGVRCPKEMGPGNNLEMIKGYILRNRKKLKLYFCWDRRKEITSTARGFGDTPWAPA